MRQPCPTMHATHRDTWSIEALGIDRAKSNGCFAECAVLCVTRMLPSITEDVGAMGVVLKASMLFRLGQQLHGSRAVVSLLRGWAHLWYTKSPAPYCIFDPVDA
jgi:hypothetical protein